MCRRGLVREQQRLRVRHGVPDVKMVVLSRQKHKLNLVNLEPREKFVCGSADCAQVWCGV